MKKNMMVMAFGGLVFAAGLVLAGANMAIAGETLSNDWDGFMKLVDPGSITADRGPICQRAAAANSATSSDWDAFMLSIDPSTSANIDKVLVCTDRTNKEVAGTTASDWEAFIKIINPRS